MAICWTTRTHNPRNTHANLHEYTLYEKIARPPQRRVLLVQINACTIKGQVGEQEKMNMNKG